MLRAVAIYLNGIPAVFIDGLLYTGLGLFAFLMTRFGSDEAAKYVTPQWLFWIVTTIGSLNAICLALKLFRSSQYAEHQQAKKEGTAPPFTTKP